MCRSCSDRTDENEKKVNELLSLVGILVVVEQGRWAVAEAGRALVYLNRSERASALGFGTEIARLAGDAAIRTRSSLPSSAPVRPRANHGQKRQVKISIQSTQLLHSSHRRQASRISRGARDCKSAGSYRLGGRI